MSQSVTAEDLAEYELSLRESAEAEAERADEFRADIEAKIAKIRSYRPRRSRRHGTPRRPDGRRLLMWRFHERAHGDRAGLFGSDPDVDGMFFKVNEQHERRDEATLAPIVALLAEKAQPTFEIEQTVDVPAMVAQLVDDLVAAPGAPSSCGATLLAA